MNNKIAKIIAVLSIFIGVMVIVGWFLDVTVLTSILPQWIRMKFATALCFIFSGIIVAVISNQQTKPGELQKIMLTIFAMLNILIMGTLFLGSIFGFQSGMENISFIDRHEVATPIFQGRPSVATMANFLLIAYVALLYSFKNNVKNGMVIAGWIICGIGILGIVGYVTGIHALYFEISGFSNAIAVHTTTLFALLGVAIILLGKNKE